MNKEAFAADRIEVSVQGTFKTEHVFASSYQALGKLAMNAARSEGFFLGADQNQFAIQKTSFWKPVYEIKTDQQVVGTASPLGALKRAFQIEFEARSYVLKPGGSRLRSWTLWNQESVAMCEFLPRKSLKRGAQIRIGAEIPLALIVLSYILVIKRWQEESSAG